MMNEIKIPHENGHLNAIFNESNSQTKCLLLMAHGAGAPMTHVFMEKMADQLASCGFNVIRFNFPYIDAGKKFPGNPKANISAWRSVFEYAKDNFNFPIIISGKSYGGRMASHLLSEYPDLQVKGIVYFGFPLHAPGKTSMDRANHLGLIKQPQLFLQGTNDALANFELISQLTSNLKKATLHSLDHADHSFKIKGRPQLEVISELAKAVNEWSDGLD